MEIEGKEKIEGVLLVDKPPGMTSHDVVDRVRKLAGTRRVGHTGTLDPMASGLLVVCVGGATRVSPFFTGLPKEYSGIIKLGAISSTYDAEGSIMAQPCPLPRDPKTIVAAMRRQTGTRTQLPPPYSAVKVRGKKLYEYARRGEEVPQKPRQVRIHQFELVEYCEPEIRFFARVGSGTYVRSMAHDLGIQLECGAYLSSLRRESVGQFHVSQAAPLSALIENPELLRERLLGLGAALGHMPKITVDARVERNILHGQGFTTLDILACETIPRPAEDHVVLNAQGKVLSIVRGEPMADESARAAGSPPLFFRPLRVLGQS